jgi:hypothetical protein
MHGRKGLSMKRSLLIVSLVPLLLWFADSAAGQKEPLTEDRRQVEEAAQLVSAPSGTAAQYDYVVTGAVRLLLFWVSRDDVGQGYIRIGTLPDDSSVEIVQLLMGSDPAKAPLSINNWGAVTEAWRPSDGSGALFAFMKAPKDGSMATAKDEVEREKEKKRYQYQGVISRIRNNRHVSITVPISSSSDFTLHQLPQAQQMVLEQLKTAAQAPRTMDVTAAGGCARACGFLTTLRELLAAAVSERRAPMERCYTYLDWSYSMTIRSLEPVKEMKVALKMRGAGRKLEKVYRNLMKAQLRVVNLKTKNPTDFKIVFGDAGALKWIPVQIEFQPNWWFRVTVNLRP